MKKLIPVLLLTLLSGCASIVSGGPENLTISSNPSDANMTICNERTGQCLTNAKTPYTASLERDQGFFKAAKYKIRCEKEGYTPLEKSISANVNGWYFGNIVFGGLVGLLIVDPATGAMWSLPEKNLIMDLSPVAREPEKPQVESDSAINRKEEESPKG